LAYNPDDGFIYTMTTNGLFARYTIDGTHDATTLPQPGVNIQGLTYIGRDQFLGIAGNSLRQFSLTDETWLELTTLSQQFPNAGLAFDFGVLYAITSASDQLFTIDLTTYEIAALGSRGSSNGGGLSTTCMFDSVSHHIACFLIDCCL
jgi:hypothetical protein